MAKLKVNPDTRNKTTYFEKRKVQYHEITYADGRKEYMCVDTRNQRQTEKD